MPPVALDNPRQLLPEPAIPIGARCVRSAVAVTVEVNDPRARAAAPNGESYDIKIVASTKRVARDGGIIPIESWARDLSRYLANPVVLWAHSYREPPVAQTVHLELDVGQGQLIEYWRFLDGISDDEEDRFCGRLKALYAVRGLRAASVGFIVHEWRDPTDQEKIDALQKGDPEPRWVAVRSELLETSCVPVPADPYALSVDRALEEAQSKHIDVALVAMRWRALRQPSPTAPAPAAAPTEPAPAAPRAAEATAPAAPPPAAEPVTPAPPAQTASAPSPDAARETNAAACPAPLTPEASSEVLVPEDRLRALMREELAALARGDSPTPADAGILALSDEDLRRVVREELDEVLVRRFGYPPRSTPAQRMH